MIHALGKACLDNLMYVDHYPEKNGLVHITRTESVPGGMAANALIAAARLGSPVTLHAHCGRDSRGERLMGQLEASGIAGDSLYRTGKTDYSNIIIHGDVRTILSRRAMEHHKSAADFAPPLAGGDVLLIDCTVMAGTGDLLEKAARAGVITVMDISPANDDPRIRDFLPFVDYLIPSLDWARSYAGFDDPDRLAGYFLGLGAGELIMTDGGNPLRRYGEGSLRLYAPPRVDVVNSNGAGDTFHGAFCHGLSRRWDRERIVRFSLAAASSRCRHSGIDRLEDEAYLLSLAESVECESRQYR